MRIRRIEFGKKESLVLEYWRSEGESTPITGHPFKGLGFGADWSPAVVLYGENDVGKSNVMEALRCLLSRNELEARRQVRQGRIEASVMDHDWEPVDATVVLELEDLDDDQSNDARRLATLMQYSRHPPRDPITLLQAWTAQVTAGREELDANPGFPFLDDGEAGPLLDDHQPQTLSGLRSKLSGYLRGGLVGAATPEARRNPAFEDDVARVIDALVYSPYLVSSWTEDELAASLAMPPENELDPETRAARERLRGHEFADTFEVSGINLVALVAGDADVWEKSNVPRATSSVWSDPLLLVLNEWSQVAAWWDVIEFEVGSEASVDIRDRIESFVDERLRPPSPMPVRVPGTDVPLDSWLEQGQRETDDEGDGDPWVRLHKEVRVVCGDLGELSTALSPRFLRRQFRIEISPLRVDIWRHTGGRRVGVWLSRRGAEPNQSYEIDECGAGVRLWASYSIAEALRGLRSAEEPAGHAWFIHRSRGPIQLNLPPPEALYLLDEPERHLFPDAQLDAAKWTAERVDLGANVVVATHAVAFLELSSDRTEYLRLHRDDRGLTRGESITGDRLGALERLSLQLGIRRGELMNLTRGLLIVEGVHDRRVIEHFYGELLRRNRLFALPLHGTSRTPFLTEAEFLRALRIPFFVLFDNTVDDQSHEYRRIRSLLAHWPVLEPAPVPIQFASRDILWAIPDGVWTRAVASLGGAEWPGKEVISVEFDRAKTEGGIKAFARRRVDLGHISDDDLLTEMLNEAPREPMESGELAEAMERLEAAVRGSTQLVD